MAVATTEVRAATLVVDARQGSGAFGPGRLLCGLPLVTRHVLSAAYDPGFARVVVVVSPATRDEVERALAGRVVPRIAVELADAPPDDGRLVSVDAREVVTRPDLKRLCAGERAAQPALLVTDGPSAEAGRKRLVTAISKSVQMDGIVCWLFMRPISRALVRMMLRTGLTPNQVSVLAGIVGVVASAVVAVGGRWASSLLPLILLEASMILDCCDGDIARLKFKFSRLGEWLDTLGDEVSQITLMSAFGIGLYRDGAGLHWLYLGLGGSLIMLATVTIIYTTLHRRQLPVDSAQFPWFFGKPGGGGDSTKGIAWLLSWVFRRDFFITLMGILCALHLRTWAIWALFGGAAVMGTLMLIHQVVTRLRRAS